MRTWSIVTTTGWTLTELEQQARTEVDRLLRVSNLKTGIQAQYRSLNQN